MTIMAICTLVLNAVVGVLLICYGLWFRNIVNQQLRTKDTTIETLNAAIKLHEVEIAGLKGDRAPAIAAEYKTIREYADRMTADKQGLDQRLKKLTERQKEEAKIHMVETAMAEVDGLLVASDLLLSHFANYGEVMSSGVAPEQGFFQSFVLGTLDVLKKIESETESRNEDVKRMFDERLIFVPLDPGDLKNKGELPG